MSGHEPSSGEVLEAAFDWQEQVDLTALYEDRLRGLLGELARVLMGDAPAAEAGGAGDTR